MGKKSKQLNKFWEMKMSANNAADIFIYGDIVSYQWDDSETTALSFKNELDSLGDINTINLHINSPGGSVFEGIAIHNMLKQHKAKVNVHVDALAVSIASVIAMAGDTIFMPKNSMMMIHNPWTFAVGNASDLRKQADDLDRIGNSSKQTYLQKAGDKLTEEKLQEMLDAETWLSADEAYNLGLCDVVEEANPMAASISQEWIVKFENVPKSLLMKRKNVVKQAENVTNNAVVINSSPAFNVGDRVGLTIPPHIEGHTAGEVREAVLTWVYGILFDGMEDMGIHHWYVESELKAESDNTDENPQNKKKKKKMDNMPGMDADEMAKRQKLADEAKANSARINTILEGLI